MLQRIYIAGPYTAPTPKGVQVNLDAAFRAAICLIRLGHVPYCPHLTHYLDAAALALGVNIEYEEWLGQDREWLALCDALLYLAPSPGADRERDWAAALGLVIYHRLDEIPPAEQKRLPAPLLKEQQQQWDVGA
jgi:hypothetical protein